MLFLQLTQQVGQKSLLRSSVEMAHVGFRDGVGRRLKLARWAASLSPKLAAWREGGLFFLQLTQQVVQKSLLRSYGGMTHGGWMESMDLLMWGMAGRNRCSVALNLC